MTPDQLTALIVALGALATAVGGLVGAITVLYRQVEANRQAINGRMDQLIATSRMVGHAEGVALGHALNHSPEVQDPPSQSVDTPPGAPVS